MLRFLSSEAGDNPPPLPVTKSRVMKDILIPMLPVKQIDASTLGMMEKTNLAMRPS
jgi:hypothetical protein